jgi:hypothetical protein
MVAVMSIWKMVSLRAYKLPDNNNLNLGEFSSQSHIGTQIWADIPAHHVIILLYNNRMGAYVLRRGSA